MSKHVIVLKNDFKYKISSDFNKTIKHKNNNINNKTK